MSLQLISQAIAGKVPVAGHDGASPQITEHIQNQRQKMMRGGFITLSVGIVMAALFGILGRLMSTVNPTVGIVLEVFNLIGALIVMLGVGIMGYSAFFFMPKVPADHGSAPLTGLPQAEPTTKLPLEYRSEATPSVTEQTTLNLESSQPDAVRQMRREPTEKP
jgi:hypothetical protein